MPSVYLTKSRFKIGYECPTKLYYQDRAEYGNNMADNSFLKALARGGFQVGALAQIYYPGGVEITTKDKAEAAAQTAALLEQPTAVIYEAAFLFENTFIKADVVVKKNDRIELIEVKAKSFDPRSDDFFTKTSQEKGSPALDSKWESYLVDVAFQTWVLKKCHPKMKIKSFLMLADKSSVASVEGLNQRFFLQDQEGARDKIVVSSGTNLESIGDKILLAVPVDAEVLHIWNMEFEGKSFDEHVRFLAAICKEGRFEKPKVSRHCKSCEFRIDPESKTEGKLSGFENCWTDAKNLKKADFDKPWIFDIWNLHYKKTEKFVAQNKLHIVSVTEDDIDPKPDDRGLSASERQWKQVDKVKSEDTTPYIDHGGLNSEMKSWTFPLHFIDFETSAVAIPFNKGRRPYEQIAFQFSHHIMHKDGRVIHQTEYINMKRGEFPNFEFVRALMHALSGDSGTIFRYAPHENTVLRQIRDQILRTDEEIVEREAILNFIDSITEYKEGKHKVEGPRNMVDLCELVKRYFYHPLTEGSNSIKAVLPAILTESKFLQDMYSKPLYGSKDMPSKNFSSGKRWIETDGNGKLISNPYKLLAPVFSDLDLKEMDSLLTEGSIEDGGAAMTAYARMQFTQMSEAECERVKAALLRYCELDTLAMVMIVQYWQQAITTSQKTAA